MNTEAKKIGPLPARKPRGMDWAAWNELKAARKIEIAAEKAAKQATAKTCQICGRPIFAETGVIAHHGYQRPDGMGYQTASCPGARHLPFEVSRDVLGLHIAKLTSWLADLKADIEAVREERAKTVIAWKVYNPQRGRDEKKSVDMNRADFDAWKQTDEGGKYCRRMMRHSFEECRDSYARVLQDKANSIAAEMDFQQKRFDAWTPKPI